MCPKADGRTNSTSVRRASSSFACCTRDRPRLTPAWTRWRRTPTGSLLRLRRLDGSVAALWRWSGALRRRLGARAEHAAERVPAERGRDERAAQQQVDHADQEVGPPAHRVHALLLAGALVLRVGAEPQADPVGAEQADQERDGEGEP